MSKRIWIGGAAVAVLAAAGIVVAYVVDYTDGARPGAALAGIATFDGGRKADVKLPIGTVQVQVGSPSQEYAVNSSAKKVRAADGAVFVPVSWEIAGAQVAVSNSLPVYQFQLALVADGRRYDLQAAREDDHEASVPISSSGAVAAVVQGDGDGESLKLEIEYDGLTQVLDVDSGKIDSGLAAPYYAAGGRTILSTGQSCSAVSAADERTVRASLNRCSVGPVTLSPYVGGLGWVRFASERWASVPYSLQVASLYVTGSTTSYVTTLRRFDVTLDGATPTADLLRYRNRSSVLISGVKVFKTSTAPKTVGVATELLGDARFYRAGTRIFRNAQTFPLR